MSIPYEQPFTQTFHHNRNLITEQDTGEQNPLFQPWFDLQLDALNSCLFTYNIFNFC
jgi:hypothetical protein